MQVSRWGNSLAVRLPAAVVEALGLCEGDDVTIEVAEPHRFRIARDSSRDEALANLRALGWTFPPGYGSSRDDARPRRLPAIRRTRIT